MKKIIVVIVIVLALSSGRSIFSEQSHVEKGKANSNEFDNITDVKKITGETLKFKEVDETVKHYMKEANVTGLSLAILNNNKIAYISSYGYKDKENNKSLDTNTIMLGASFSKVVFTYIVLQLVQDNIIDLDKPLYNYLKKPLPEYSNYDDLKDNKLWEKLTPRMCLNHTTGFPNSRQGKLEFVYDPGSKYAYSGEGINLLQLVVEEITNKSVEELALNKVFKPFEMERTSYLWQNRFKNNYAFGHDIIGANIDYTKFNQVSAGGSLLTTIADFARFIEAIMQSNGLTKEMFNEMLSPSIRIKSKYQFPTISNEVTDENDSINLSYGLGWGLIFSEYGKAFFKEGHGLGFQNYTINFLDKKTSMIIMTNSENGESIFKVLLDKIIGDTYTPWKWERYIPYNEIKPKSIGRYLYDLMDNIDGAIEKYYQFKTSPSKNTFVFNEAELNGLAYQMIKEGKIDNAIRLFMLNVEEYPNSSNAYDSLAEAYMIDGQNELAIENYTRSLELDPGNVNAIEMLKQLK